MIPKILTALAIAISLSGENGQLPAPVHPEPSQTEITKWQYGKKAAISLTYDDNTINQFRIALPIMNKLGFRGTFYVITGSVPGAEYSPTFIGRPVEDIIAETGTVATNEDNFFERASAVRFLGYADTYKYQVRAGELYEQGHIKEAYELMDQAYRKVRQGAFEKSPDSVEAKKALDDVLYVSPDVDLVTWDQLRKYAQQGHEIGSHTVSHPYLSVLDQKNMLYELTKSKEELLKQLGPEATFSAECPFGTEEARVMDQALERYPALRNRMPEPYLEELDRSSDTDPTSSPQKYVQWQRGPLSDTPMSLMKSWVDTSLEKDNIWLVLVFHGIEGVGWEPLSGDDLKEYFGYIKSRADHLWIAPFKEVTQYMRERMTAHVQTRFSDQSITIDLSHSLDPSLYALPLTLKTYVPKSWAKVKVSQGASSQEVKPGTDGSDGPYILYQATPNAGSVTLTSVSQ